LSCAAIDITVFKTISRAVPWNWGALGRLPGPPWLHYSPRSSTLVLPKYVVPFREIFLSGDGIVLKIFAKLNAFLVAVHFEVQ
jgi:hypothetical protein